MDTDFVTWVGLNRNYNDDGNGEPLTMIDVASIMHGVSEFLCQISGAGS